MSASFWAVHCLSHATSAAASSLARSTMKRLRVASGLQDDGDGAIVNGLRKDGHAGKGLGTEDFHHRRRRRGALRKFITSTALAAAYQQASHFLIGGTEKSLALIEQDSGADGGDLAKQ